MPKKDIKIYVQEDNINWIDNYPMGESRCGSVSTAADWAITHIRRGAKTAFLALNLDERRAVIASLNGTIWDFIKQGPESLAWHLQDWFKMDGGMMWEWQEDKVKALLDKVRSFNPAEIAGIVCWSQGFWQDCDNQELDKWADDLSRLM